jgi:hypothetical protein
MGDPEVEWLDDDAAGIPIDQQRQITTLGNPPTRA